MNGFYSEILEQAIKLLYFQADTAKFPEGVKLLEKAVANEEPDAFYFLARCYAWEDGNVRENRKKARELSRRGIELGSDLCVLGAERMGELKGQVKAAMQNTLKEAFQNVLQTAKNGEPMAQYAIGLFYFWGDMFLNFQSGQNADAAGCVKENAMEALKWFRTSASLGCIPAFRNAFNSVREGTNGVPKDLKAALDWMETVADRVDLRDYYYSIALSYSNLKDADHLLKWAKRGIEAGDSDCAVVLGNAYRYGEGGMKVNTTEGIRYLKMASDWGNMYGDFHLGYAYYQGAGFEQNYETAFAYFDKAARMGHKRSLYYLAKLYYWGKGTVQNQTKAFSLIQELIRLKQEYPKEILGLCCLYGYGTDIDYSKAKQILEEAAPDCPEAWKHLGDMYDKGLGMPEDVSRAVSCYQKAVQGGYTEASEELLRFKKTFLGKWKRR